MHAFKSIYSLLLVLACLFAGSYAKKKEQEDQALNDLYAGIAGLKEAAQNPALLAQLMRDLQVSFIYENILLLSLNSMMLSLWF
jgi:hypothetical protein